MHLQLKSKIIDRLLSLPESGMGYQVVDLVLSDGRIIPNVMILNGEIATLPDSLRGISSSEIADVRQTETTRR